MHKIRLPTQKVTSLNPIQKFINQIILFIIPITIFLISGLFLPPTPRSSKSLLFGVINKESLLQNTPIFVGSSNLSFGLNSQMIKDSLTDLLIEDLKKYNSKLKLKEK